MEEMKAIGLIAVSRVAVMSPRLSFMVTLRLWDLL